MAPPKYDPSTPSSAYQRMEARRVLCRLLMDGTAGLRTAWQKYVPQLQGESVADWEARARFIRLLPAYSEAVERCPAQVFKRPIMLGADVPRAIRGQDNESGSVAVEGWWWNIDMQKHSGSDFAAGVFKDMWAEGLPMVLVSNTGRGRPEDESIAGMKGRRPFFVHYRPCQIKRVVSRRTEDGQEVPGRIHLAEPLVDPVWGEECGERILVCYRAGEDPIRGGAPLGPGLTGDYARFEYYRKAPEGSEDPWTLSSVPGEEPGEFAPHVDIPAVFFPGPRPIAPFEAYPWFEDLAYLNHYHALARNGLDIFLQFITTAIVELAGYDKDKAGEYVVTAGGGKLIFNARDAAQSRVQILETSGASAGVAKADLKDIEDQMRAMGSRPILDQVPKTLGQAVLDKSESESILQQSARNLKDGLEQCLMFAAAYIGETSGGSLDINMEYSLDEQAGAKLEAAGKARTGRDGEPDLSRKTWWEILQKHGALPEDFSSEEEERRLEAEAKQRAAIEASTQEIKDAAFGKVP